MTQENKQRIADLVKEACKKTSQVRWANTNKFSGATINMVVNGKWDLISDKMWNKLASAVGFLVDEWHLAPTTNHKLISDMCDMARSKSMSLALSADAGIGKTATLSHYANTHKNVFHIQCAEHWSKKVFIHNLYRALGKAPGEMTIAELAEGVIEELRQHHRPLVILDEADKLRDPIVLFFIEMYNRLDGICGFLHVGAPYLAKAWEKNAMRDKRGFREVYSRIGRRFLVLNKTRQKDVRLICEMNGITDEESIAVVWNGVEQDPDLRRVRREVEILRAAAAAQAA